MHVLIEGLDGLPGYPKVWYRHDDLPYEDMESMLICALKECRHSDETVILGYRYGALLNKKGVPVREFWFAEEDLLRPLNIPHQTKGWKTMVKPTQDGKAYLQRYLESVGSGDPYEWKYEPVPGESIPSWYR